MPKKRASASSTKELPPCHGPKLHVFQHQNSPIKWMERLDIDREEGEETEGYVFRAKIRTREYAIKVFKFYNPLSSKYFWGPLLGEDTALETAAYYTDPFFAECRAYGRIKEATKKRSLKAQIAIPCHGFIFLKENDERTLSKLGIDFGIARIDSDFQQNTEGGWRVRAIVKDLAPQDTGVDKKSVGKILRGIRALNKHKIYNMDIHLDNFRNGQLVDFGSSWTEPHLLLDAQHDHAARNSKLSDLEKFDEMIEDEEIQTDVRARPNPKYCRKLRAWG
ncbi:hypothetical protein G7Z17_g2465 [Cylindrodendrum hubeiense]|uniref:Uncharacterized protein n=1 Tax=Cylindrodendrum hubeiense TaxID=595255 RepID=A0A9P5HKR4_9HYPO|nr:hypothetical protein G7Z17_g2465 [Cylindrodendrum hubeiense]